MVRDDAASSSRRQAAGAKLGLLLAGLLAVFYAAYFAARPIYNWDMIAYVAVALHDAGEPAQTIHRQTYDIVKAAVPPAQFDRLTQDSDYRRTVAADAERFAWQLPFYAVKPIYPALISLLYRAGVEPVTASVAVAAASYAGICLLLYCWISRWLPPTAAVPLMALLSLCPVLTPVAQLSTPDALSVLTLLGGMFLIIELDRIGWGAMLFIVAIAVRPENVIVAGIVFLYLALVRRVTVAGFLALNATALACYVGLTLLHHSYRWTTLFYYTFGDMMIDPAGFVSPFDLGDYLRVYVVEIDKTIFLGSEGFTLFALVGLGALLLKVRHRPWQDRYVHLILIAAAWMAARTAALPGDAHRALLAPYLLLTIALIEACARLEWRRVSDERPICDE